MLQLPTPEPTPHINPGDIERLVNAIADKTLQLDLERQVFIAFVLVVVAVIIYLYRRPKQVNERTVAVEALSTVANRQGKEIADLQEAREQQDARYLESISAISNATNNIGEAVQGLNRNTDKLATYTENVYTLLRQLSERQAAHESALQTMVNQGSEPLRNLIKLSEAIRDLANEIKASVNRTECRQDELLQAVRDLKHAEETVSAIAEETGETTPVDGPKDAAA